MATAAIRAGSWPAVAGLATAATVPGGFGVLFPAATTVLFPMGFALCAAAAAFTLDEPASPVVDVTPTSTARRTAARAPALLSPLTAGTALILAGALRGLALPWGPITLALAGNVLLGFTVACVGRTRSGVPGPAASTAVVAILILPATIPLLARRLHTFPTPDGGGLSSDKLWWIVLALCVVAIATSVSHRRTPWGECD